MGRDYVTIGRVAALKTSRRAIAQHRAICSVDSLSAFFFVFVVVFLREWEGERGAAGLRIEGRAHSKTCSKIWGSVTEGEIVAKRDVTRESLKRDWRFWQVWAGWTKTTAKYRKVTSSPEIHERGKRQGRFFGAVFRGTHNNAHPAYKEGTTRTCGSRCRHHR